MGIGEKFKRLKTDKSYRNKFIAIALIIIVLIYLNPGQKLASTFQPASVCNQYNTFNAQWGFSLFEDTGKINQCVKSGCGVETYVGVSKSFLSGLSKGGLAGSITELVIISIASVITAFTGGAVIPIAVLVVGGVGVGAITAIVSAAGTTAYKCVPYVEPDHYVEQASYCQFKSGTETDKIKCGDLTTKCYVCDSEAVARASGALCSTSLQPFATMYDATIGKVLPLTDCNAKMYTLGTVIVFALLVVI